MHLSQKVDHQHNVDQRIVEYIKEKGKEPETLEVSGEEYAALFLLDMIDVMHVDFSGPKRTYRGITLKVLVEKKQAAQAA